MALSPQITNIILILGSMQLSKRINFEDPNILMGIRAMYIISNLIIVSLYLYIGYTIKQKKELKTLKYIEPAQVGSGEQPKLITTTDQEYDEGQLQSLYKSQAMGVAMMAFMHLYMKYTNPLLIQSIIPVKGALESNLVKIHLFGQPATGDLKRPWKAAAGFMGMGQNEVKTDKASIEAAERSGRGGAKEE